VALNNAQLETLIWVLIYSGLLIFCLGIFVVRAGEPLLGGALVAAGVVDAMIGVVLIWRRSKRSN
jgi:hypothetical protein